MSVAYINH